MGRKPTIVLILITLAALCGCGCVQHTLTVESNPPGALVYFNGQEIGRTPFTHSFTWYGIYNVEVRPPERSDEPEDGSQPRYATLRTTAHVIAPWWQWVPFDFFTIPLPLTDNHILKYTLLPVNERDLEPDLILKRGEKFAEQLESTRKPPTTKPSGHGHHEKPATKPAQ